MNDVTADFEYKQYYDDLHIHSTATVRQHHMFAKKIAPMLKDVPDPELLITIPETVHITLEVVVIRICFC